MNRIAEFLEIPVRDDATEFATIQRGFETLRCLSDIGVTVEKKNVADLGAGFGSLSIAAARSDAAHVCAVDVHPDRLDEISARARRCGVDVETRTANLLLDWPGPPEADIAFLLGVVEYAGLWSECATPSELQRALFRTAWQVLRPGGRLIVGTKNRAWPGFAVRDVHTAQPLVNVLPRNLADRMSRRLSGMPYRHHLHTPTAWARLLRAAGFSQVDAYVPYMSYQFPIKLVRKPKFSHVRDVIYSAPAGEQRRATLGRAPVAKATLMAAGALVGLPISHSTVLVATK